LEDEKGFAADMRDGLERCRAFFVKERPDELRKEIERWPDIDASRGQRLREYTQDCDRENLHDAANQLFPQIIRCPEKYCLSQEWVSWQFVRVSMVWQMERAILHQARGRLKHKDLEDDYADVQYVTLLSRADGLLMHDPFWQLLAKAAFPEKNVFSSLEEVPQSYRCDWADR
jgi:hypothetical protein